MADKRYRAFISYSQKNKDDGRRIQRWLEAYRLPKGVGIGGPRRLGRFFRDDEEMSASPDVGATLRGAIEDSESLIVISSPQAAQSRWVNSEIQHFRLTGRGDRIFAVIVDGIPNSGDPTTECLPLALKAGDWDGLSMPVEPLALDLRTESKARIRARLAAGLLNLSFDDLWKREQRRRRWRVLQWSAACLAIVGTLGVLGLRLLDARRTARAQERADRLAGAIATLGANGPLALGTLRDLLKSDGADQAATDVARMILSWAKSPSEVPPAFPIPRLFNVNNRLMLHGKAAPLEIGDATPHRRIGFSRGRLIVVYTDRVVSLDSRSGTVLDTLEQGADRDLRNVLWRGMALEGADGTGIVAANHVGISNGLLWHVLMAVTPTGKLSLINLPRATESWGVQFQSVDEVFISPTCDALGLLDGPADQADTTPKLLVRLRNGLEFGEVTTTMAGGVLSLLPPGLTDEGTGSWRADVDPDVEKRGCRNAGFDSAGSYGLTGLGGLVLASDVVTSPAPPSEWRHVRPVAPVSDESSSQPWEVRPLAADRSNPCARGCRTVEEDGGHEDFDGEGALTFSWMMTSLPAGGLAPGPVADQFAASPLHTFHAQHNAGIESVWCRRVQGTSLACLRALSPLEYREDWSDVDLRSASGRFMFYSSGAGPFRMFDVQSMRHATPAGTQSESKPGAAAFSVAPDDRLFVFSDNRLSALEPDATSGKFVDISGSLSWQRRLAGIDASNPVIGVTSPVADELIAASENGLLVRFEWRTGRSVWSRQVTGIGKVRAIRRAPAGGYVALIGERGVRIVRARDGLLASGALLPSYLFDAKFDASPCIDSSQPVTELKRALTDVTISDTGTLTATCGAARFSWTAPPFSGDTVSRLDTLLAPPPPPR